MPQHAPALLARFHQMPMTSAGKNEAAARLKAQATSSTMIATRYVATYAEMTAVTTRRTLVIVNRTASEVRGLITL